MSTFAERLLEVTPAMSNRDVAALIADKMIFYTTTDAYRFQINHDVRPPKCEPCPVGYGWIVKDKVGIEISNKILAKQWLTKALVCGYKVESVDSHRKPTNQRTESIELVRNRAEYHQRPKPEYDDDDDIPF